MCGEQVKVTVLEMKMVSGYLFISQFWRGLFFAPWISVLPGMLLVSNFLLRIRLVKQYNKIKAWKSPYKGAVELGLISGIFSSRGFALVQV